MTLSKREEEVNEEGDNAIKEIHQYAEQIIESVQQCEQFLVKQVEALVQHELKLLGEQVKEAETALAQLKSCEEYIEQCLEVGSPQQILLEKQRMVQGMEVVSKQINPEVFKPVEEADITFTKNKALVDSCKDIGKVRCSFSHPLTKPRKVITGFDRPLSIAVNSEGVMVVGGEGSNCITVIDKDGSIVRSFGLDGIENGWYGLCHGVAFTTDDNIVVSDTMGHSLYKQTLQGEYITSVGSEGCGPSEFRHPRGVAVHPATGQIYVADEYNHRIQVINDSFTYSHSIGSKGMALGQLQHPYDVALDSDGNVYVCNTGNTSIDVFTSSGTFLRRFGSKGCGDGELDDIKSVTVDGYNLVYVTDSGNHRISIFTTEGQFVMSVGAKDGQFKDLCGITIDVSGNLYVIDKRKRLLMTI